MLSLIHIYLECTFIWNFRIRCNDNELCGRRFNKYDQSDARSGYSIRSDSGISCIHEEKEGEIMENLAHLFSMDMVMVTLRMAIPLILASIGSVICERSGIINLGKMCIRDRNRM